jgi:hypothetical protein
MFVDLGGSGRGQGALVVSFPPVGRSSSTTEAHPSLDSAMQGEDRRRGMVLAKSDG